MTNMVRIARLLGVMVVALLAAQAVPVVAFADPAGPTDYLSEIVSIEPATPSIEVSVIGGDSFVQLIASAGTDVVVLGYQSEQYVWFRPDGTVLENRNAPTTYTNRDRFAGADIPPTATRVANPDWEQVASNGQFSWHDHRAHWMQSSRPAGKGVGDRVVEGVIPLLVDGREVDVTVISTWQPAASRVPAVLGAVAAAALAGVVVWQWRRDRRWALLVVPLASAAVVAGVWQYLSLPPETSPRTVWWLFPASAAVAAVVAVVGEALHRGFLARGATLIVGTQLFLWGLIKSDGLRSALIPTGAPGWFDRIATASALVGGAALTCFGIVALFTPPGRPAPTGAD